MLVDKSTNIFWNMIKMLKTQKKLQKSKLYLIYSIMFQEIAIPLPTLGYTYPPSGNSWGVTNFLGAERNFLGVWKEFPNDFIIIINY